MVTECFEFRRALAQEAPYTPADPPGSRLYELRALRCAAQAGVQLVTDMPHTIYAAVKETGKGEAAQFYFLKTIEHVSDLICGEFVPAVIGNTHLDKLAEALFDVNYLIEVNYDYERDHSFGHSGWWDSPGARKTTSWLRVFGQVQEAIKCAQAKVHEAEGGHVAGGEIGAFW